MSHEVETMAYANAVPWHGLGVNVRPDATVDEIVHAVGLDWKVHLHPLCASEQPQTEKRERSNEDVWATSDPALSIPVNSHYALVRETDNRVLSVVGNRWKPVQNREAFWFFKYFVEAGGATMETAGSLRGGRIVWGLANLGTAFRLRGKDVVKGYLLLVSPHVLGQPVMARVTTVRVVCANTLALALSEKANIEARWGHRTVFDPREAADTIGIAREDISQFEKNARLLQSLNLSREEALRILAPVYQATHEPDEVAREEVKLGRNVVSIMDAYESAPGAVPGTGWGLLNAVTYHGDHKLGDNPDTRLSSAWVGEEARRRTVILKSLLELA